MAKGALAKGAVWYCYLPSRLSRVGSRCIWSSSTGSTLQADRRAALRYGLPPSKIAYMAWHAWRDAEAGSWPQGIPEDARPEYDLATIRKWLEVFAGRYFGFAQFKRSALPNGPKVSWGGSLSPRADWRAPSDGTAKLWLEELRTNVPETG